MLKPSAAGVVAGAIALGMDVLYVAIILSEGNNEMVDVLPFALLIGGVGVAACAGSVVVEPRLRAALLWPPAVVLTGIGLLAIFSIGLPLLVAGVLCAVAAHHPDRRAQASDRSCMRAGPHGPGPGDRRR